MLCDICHGMSRTTRMTQHGRHAASAMSDGGVVVCDRLGGCSVYMCHCRYLLIEYGVFVPVPLPIIDRSNGTTQEIKFRVSCRYAPS
jgi:hypothetical protein